MYLTLMVILLLFAIRQKLETKSIQGDYLNFYTGGTLWSRGEYNSLYNLSAQQMLQQSYFAPNEQNILAFRSLPFVAAMFALIVPFGFFKSALLFTAVSILFLLLIQITSSKTPYSIARSLVLMFTFYPTILSIYNTQVSLILASVIGLIFSCQFKRKHLLSGLLCSLLLIKPQLLIICPLLLVVSKDRFRFLAGIIVGISGLMLFGILYLGPQHVSEYIKFLLATENVENGTNILRLSSFQAIADLPYSLILNALSGLLYFWIFAKNHKVMPQEIQMLLIIVAGLLFSWHTFIYDYAILLFPMLALWESGKQRLFWVLHAVPLTIVLGFGAIPFSIMLFIGFYQLLNYGKKFRSKIDSSLYT